MNLSLALAIATAIIEAERQLPEIRVVPRTIIGSSWVADHCCATAYIADALAPEQILDAIHDATAALVAQAERSAWHPGQMPHPRTQDHPTGRAG